MHLRQEYLLKYSYGHLCVALLLFDVGYYVYKFSLSNNNFLKDLLEKRCNLWFGFWNLLVLAIHSTWFTDWLS